MLPYPDPPLRDGRVVLRRWLLEDVTLVEEAARDPLLLPGTTLPRDATPAAARAFVERQWSRNASGEGISLAIAVDGVAVGCVTLTTRRPPIADLGYWLVGRARGAGTGGRAIALVVPWALAQAGIEAVEAFVADRNIASRRLLDRAGFQAAGRRRHRVGELDEELLVYRRDAGR